MINRIQQKNTFPVYPVNLVTPAQSPTQLRHLIKTFRSGRQVKLGISGVPAEFSRCPFKSGFLTHTQCCPLKCFSTCAVRPRPIICSIITGRPPVTPVNPVTLKTSQKLLNFSSFLHSYLFYSSCSAKIFFLKKITPYSILPTWGREWICGIH